MIMAYAISMFAALMLVAALVNMALAGAAISLNGLQLLRRKCGRRALTHAAAPPAGRVLTLADAPFVSIHVATHDEPPGLVIETLNALAALDYPCFEVILIDNNTADAAKWRPVKAHMAALGPRFRFAHRRGVIGAKAGALNIALGMCDPVARYVAIVDADYQVSRDFLSSAIAAFGGAVQFVQFPQAYRNAGSAAAVVAELSDYFRTFPTAANRSGASLLTGTLSVISLDALRSVGGWPTGSITEDAQLGVALWKAGAQGLYVDQVVGRGLLPLDLAGLRIQRSRWVTGNIQTLLSTFGDWRSLRPNKGKLAVVAQLTAWSGFLAVPLIVLGLVATIQALVPGIYAAADGIWLWSQRAAALTIMISLVGLALRALSNDNPATLGVMLSLLWTSSFCWLAVLFGHRPQFRRTPKGGEPMIARLRIDAIAGWWSLGLAVYFAAAGSPLTAAALGLAAAGLVTGPLVNQQLRQTAKQHGSALCAA